MNSVEDLDVFKLSHQLALKIYSVTKSFEKSQNVRHFLPSMHTSGLYF